MEHRREWTRWQWVGEPRPHDAARSADVESLAHDRRWNLYQWVGEVAGATSTRRWEPAPTQDTSGGFSGFGHADSGGQRWATGYSQVEPATTSFDVDDVDDSQAIA